MQYLFVLIAFVAIFANYILAGSSGSAQNVQNAIPSLKIEKAASGTSTAPSSLIDSSEGIQKTANNLQQLLQQLEQLQKNLK